MGCTVRTSSAGAKEVKCPTCGNVTTRYAERSTARELGLFGRCRCCPTSPKLVRTEARAAARQQQTEAALRGRT